MKEYLFSYGTLQRTDVQLSLFGRILNGNPDSLRGYKTVMVQIKDDHFLSRGEAPNQLTVIPTNDDHDRIQGIALEVTPDELLITDQYEPGNYGRISVELESGRKAWLYVEV